VAESLAQRFWPGEDPLGQLVGHQQSNQWYTIVGIVPTIQHESLVDRATEGTVYWHYKQQPGLGGFISLRTSDRPMELSRPASDAVASVDSDVPLFDLMALDTRIADSLGPQRVPMVLTLIFAGIAFTLAVVGIYGLLAWTVARRAGEIGVRMALGAGPAEVVRMMLGQGVRLVGIGLLAGLACALALSRAVSSLIYDVSIVDPVVYFFATVGLGAATSMAIWLPARRASGIDAATALRSQ
jgi:putative ABC transport system permease protein